MPKFTGMLELMAHFRPLKGQLKDTPSIAFLSKDDPTSQESMRVLEGNIDEIRFVDDHSTEKKIDGLENTPMQTEQLQELKKWMILKLIQKPVTVVFNS
ncbi:Oidioi.mRNA.OKI2018_I69.chr2.g6829.t1.cds [Oikopleura dioica]|uniref:Oidioi.mRNA.OKI2018_I69.chr2.g6829.t1.cds n=1 Tax=Oikopleura dioica TaxID=34765 RepID=A0ABN7TAE2_OIKDI|nr:Oidioi.mRNA.OKI2018_I69.chr2.g6829.t1.cds [Oikopleura dioica]